MSRLSALKEYAFMSALHAKGLPVPTPIDVNRHCVVMSLAHGARPTAPSTREGALRVRLAPAGFQLNSVQRLLHPAAVFSSLMELICTLASYGLIHCVHLPPPRRHLTRRLLIRRLLIRRLLIRRLLIRRRLTAPPVSHAAARLHAQAISTSSTS